jgi:hypothetical protein
MSPGGIEPSPWYQQQMACFKRLVKELGTDSRQLLLLNNLEASIESVVHHNSPVRRDDHDATKATQEPLS